MVLFYLNKIESLNKKVMLNKIMKCVYKLKCKDTNITEFYIGSSMNFIKRKQGHKDNTINLNRREYSLPLYMFINVNGGFDNWEFEVINEYKFITKKELNINEQAYIKLLDPKLNYRNAYGYDKEKKISYKKKLNCPHCGEAMIKYNINRHISRKHTK